MFTPGFFNHYERMSVGFYSTWVDEMQSLGSFANMQDIEQYVSFAENP
jgi:hypothetical protein